MTTTPSRQLPPFPKAMTDTLFRTELHAVSSRLRRTYETVYSKLAVHHTLPPIEDCPWQTLNALMVADEEQNHLGPSEAGLYNAHLTELLQLADRAYAQTDDDSILDWKVEFNKSWGYDYAIPEE